MKNTVKRFIVILLAAIMVLAPAAVTPAAAADTYQAYVQSNFKHIVHVSYDEVRCSEKPNGSNEKKAVTSLTCTRD